MINSNLIGKDNKCRGIRVLSRVHWICTHHWNLYAASLAQSGKYEASEELATLTKQQKNLVYK